MESNWSNLCVYKSFWILSGALLITSAERMNRILEPESDSCDLCAVEE